jgi:hypothetical protein
MKRGIAKHIKDAPPTVINRSIALINFAVEIWRLPKMLNKLIAKIDLDEQKKYVNQFNWFNKKAIEFFQSESISISSLEGMPFDVGMPVDPINIGDFTKDDELIVEQVLEPVILQNGKILKTGSVILRKVEK